MKFRSLIIAALSLAFPFGLIAQETNEGDPFRDDPITEHQSVEPDATEFVDGCCECSECIECCPEADCCEDGLRFGGWLQQGITINPAHPSDRFNRPVAFNDRANEYQLNQAYMYLDQPVRGDGCGWDIGGRVDFLYGTDFRFATVPGLEEHPSGQRRWNGEDRRFYGVAMPQAYVEIAGPWLGQTSIKLGHFYGVMGSERFTAPTNFFYSHSYAFNYGTPFTHSGALATVNDGACHSGWLGITRGWDNWENGASDWSVLAGFGWESCDGNSGLTFSFHLGNDFATVTGLAGERIDDTRYSHNLMYMRRLSCRSTYVLEHVLGVQQSQKVVVDNAGRTISLHSAEWYGINQYWFYDINPCYSAALRFEWFRDDDAARILVPVSFNSGGDQFLGNNYYALTAGLNWRPKSQVVVRPELRWDWSDVKGNGSIPTVNPNFRSFNGNVSSHQITIGTDIVVTW